MANNNGYIWTILQNPGDNSCFICGGRGETARHEIFYGTGRREKSKRMGLWVHLCPHCHQYGERAVHRCRETDLELKRTGQRASMRFYKWDMDRFIKEFGRNYLEV